MSDPIKRATDLLFERLSDWSNVVLSPDVFVDELDMLENAIRKDERSLTLQAIHELAGKPLRKAVK